MTQSEIDNIFTYHKPKDGQPAKYEYIREVGKQLAMAVIESCPESREKSTAITKIQEAVMWANAAIAIHE